MRAATEPPGGGSPALYDLVAQRARAVAESVARLIAFTGVTPNMLTVVGFVLTLGVAYLIASGWEQLGGVLVLAVGLFDMLDGALARVNAQKTRFGAFLDSTLDRYSEAAILAGILWLHQDDPWFVVLIPIVLAGSLLVSYARARAEGLDLRAEVGWLPRPQRVVLIALGLIAAPFGALLPALVVLAVFTNVTTLQRILHVRSALGGR